MFTFTKFMALTCVFSFSGAVIIDLGLILTARAGVIVGMVYSRRGWLILCSLVWLVSFFLSWRVLITPILARISK